ncbi:hypothetical protein DRW07_02145 [Alteromonas sediminis]|uniref:Winged helix-turn-helix domain-containing protein n=1 Tax=Alteromonas sediminis TaxID=2259342 RepID=A0A3N5YQA1_9ALTE|nr:helix-turn-helix domain-containing protein [Alteromonas sediminis]RPJ68231.1 hypothetical protein DRW07_02145 [Alteromonas sediminis]
MINRRGQPAVAPAGQQMPIDSTPMQSNQQREYSSAVSQSRAVQMARLLTYLKEHRRITTLQARHLLSIMHPAGRIKELRQEGHKIEMHWVFDFDSAGKKHKQGLYVYKGGKHG